MESRYDESLKSSSLPPGTPEHYLQYFTTAPFFTPSHSLLNNQNNICRYAARPVSNIRIVFFFHWHYSQLWALACRTMSFHFFSYLPPTLSIFSLPALEDLFLLHLSIFSWNFPFFSSLPVLEWRSFWASYPPPFSPGHLTSLSFALLSILLYFLLCSSLIVLDSSDFSIPRFHI